MTPDNGHVVLIDDSDDVRRHLGNLIRQMGYSLESYERAEDFLARAVDHEPCVLLLDMRMPGLTGLEVQQALIARSRLFPIIYISGESKMQEVIDSMKLGALDFLIKPVRHADLARVLESAMAVGRTRCEARMRQTRLADRVAQLSQRERDIFDLIVKGFPNRDIAARAGLRPDTVKKYRASILSKMDVDTTTELIELHEAASSSAR